MISISAMMMPAETNGLNQLPKKLYPHGTAVMTTLQPVAGAIGVSVFVSIMNARQSHILSQAENPLDEQTINLAMTSGLKLVYIIALIMSLFTVVMAFFVYRATPPQEETPAVEGEVE